MSPQIAAVDFGQGLTDAWGAVITFVPLLAGFLVILVVGWLIAKLVGTLVGRGLHRVGLDRALERGGLGDYLERSRHNPSELLGKLVYYTLVLVTLTLAFNVFGATNPISQLLNQVIAWIPHLVVALVIVVVAVLLARMARDLISGALGGLSYGRFLATAAAVFVVALGVIAALNQVGIATTVTQPVLIAVLATIGGILVVGVGGGMIQPMQQRWSRWLETAERETLGVRDAARDTGPEDPAATASYQRGHSDAMRGDPAATPTTEHEAHAGAPRHGRHASGGEEEPH